MLPSRRRSAWFRDMATRIVVPDEDKALVRECLIRGFVSLGATEEAARRAVDAGSVPMCVFVTRWVAHNTDYPSSRKIDLDSVKKGFYAWVHYKATVEKLVDKDMRSC